jgi:hypothetical protein
MSWSVGDILTPDDRNFVFVLIDQLNGYDTG